MNSKKPWHAFQISELQSFNSNQYTQTLAVVQDSS